MLAGINLRRKLRAALVLIALGTLVAVLEAQQRTTEQAEPEIVQRIDELLALGRQHEEKASNTAITYLQEALDKALRANLKDRMAEIRISLSASLRNAGKVIEALEQARRAVSEARLLGDTRTEALALRVQANALSNLGDYEGAIRLETEVLEISQKLQDARMEATSWGNIGVSYWRIRDWPRATEATEKALRLFTELGLKPTWIYNNSGVHAMESGHFTKAETYFQEAMELSKAENSTMWQALLQSNLGDLAVRRKQPAEALEILLQAEAAEAVAVQPWIRQRILRHRAQALSDLGQHAEAAAILREALDIARGIGDRGEQMDNWQNLATILRLTGDFAGALEANERYHALKEEILNERVRNSALVNGIELELAEQGRRLAALEAAGLKRRAELESERQNAAMARLETRAVGGAAGALLLIVVLLFWRYRATLRLRRAAAEREAAEERLRAAQLQQELDRATQERLIAEQKARLEAMRVTVRTAQDILGNALNQFQILRYAIDDDEPLSPEELDALDLAIRRANEKLQALGKQTRFQTQEIGQSGLHALVFEPVETVSSRAS